MWSFSFPLFSFSIRHFILTHHISVAAAWITGSISIHIWPPCPLSNSHFSSKFIFRRMFLSPFPSGFATITLSSSIVITLDYFSFILVTDGIEKESLH